MIIKILKISFLTVFISGLLSVGYVFWFYEYNTDAVFTKEHQKKLINWVKNTPDLPEEFHKTMEDNFPGFYSTSTWRDKLSPIFGNGNKSCRCNEIYLPAIPFGDEKKKWIPFNDRDFMFKVFLANNFTKKKCFSFNMHISDFGFLKSGIQEASKFYFNKKIDELNEREIIGLYFIQKAPSMYSPLRNKDRYEDAINSVLKKNNIH